MTITRLIELLEQCKQEIIAVGQDPRDVEVKIFSESDAVVGGLTYKSRKAEDINRVDYCECYNEVYVNAQGLKN